MWRRVGPTIVLAVVSVPPHLTGQGRDRVPVLGQPASLAFEVASIRENHDGLGERRGVTANVSPGGRFDATNIGVPFLLMGAFGVQALQIADLPSWARTDRFDIHAQLPEQVGRAQLPLMIRTLLQDRFGLVIRHEMRAIPAYLLLWGMRPRR